MNIKLMKRLEALEQHTKKRSIPDLIMIFYQQEKGVWIVRESYILPAGDFKTKSYEVENMTEYTLPDGFDGTCIIDELSMPDGMTSPVACPSKNEDSSKCDVVYRTYD